MFIPGELIALLTFPGVVMHEIAHRFMCDILRVPVYSIKYFSIGNTRAGYVYHHKTDNIYHDLLIGLAPLFINSFFCMLFTLPYSASLNITGDGISNYSNQFLWWIGISMGANAFPSNQDVSNVLSNAQKSNVSYGIHLLCDIIKLLNWLRFIWMDFIYAFAISYILPYLIFGRSIYQ
jgi:hypothetical protein